MRRRKARKTNEMNAPRHLADPREAAILLLRSIALRDEDRHKPMTRAQLTAPMLRRLWNRPRLSAEFLEHVSAWLAVAGWCFFNASATYAVVRISAVKNWPRLGTRRINEELDEVAKGEFSFDDYEHLLINTADDLERRRASETSESEDTDDKTDNDEEQSD